MGWGYQPLSTNSELKKSVPSVGSACCGADATQADKASDDATSTFAKGAEIESQTPIAAGAAVSPRCGDGLQFVLDDMQGFVRDKVRPSLSVVRIWIEELQVANKH